MTAVEVRWYTAIDRPTRPRRRTTPCGIFGTDQRNSAHPSARRRRVAENVSIFRRSPPFLAGAGLALRSGEYHVFRAALFSIVLTLAVGQNASLLCKVVCHDARVRCVPASGLNDVSRLNGVPQRERRRQLRKRVRRGGRVCSRGCAAHRSRPGRPKRPRCSILPIGPSAD